MQLEMFFKKKLILLGLLVLSACGTLWWLILGSRLGLQYGKWTDLVIGNVCYCNTFIIDPQPSKALQQTYQNVPVSTTAVSRSFDDDLVVIYNRVPKTGSTSFINLAYDLCKRNHFHVLHINVTANMHVLSLQNQLDFVRNITGWMQVKPALYHGHMAYLDFAK